VKKAFTLSTKAKFLLLSGVNTVLLFIIYLLPLSYFYFLSATCVSAVMIGNYVFNSYNISRKNFITVQILPVLLTISVLSGIYFYQSLSIYLKTFFVVASGVLLYITLLTNNIILVVKDREEPIPLYRVSLAWSQIVSIIVSIPLFTSLYKLNMYPGPIVLLVFLIVFALTYYNLWVLKIDIDVIEITTVEKTLQSSLVAWLVSLVAISVSFLSSEDFLRSVLQSLVFLGCLGYLQNYYKNIVNKRILLVYLALISSFWIVVIFLPA
jgi:hypothetical protein